MERAILVNNGAPHQNRVKAGINWLCDRGGGTVLLPLWKDCETYFGMNREKAEKAFASQGVRLAKIGSKVPTSENLLVLYPKEAEIQEIENCGLIGDIMCVEWNPKWLEWWQENYEVAEYEVEDNRD